MNQNYIAPPVPPGPEERGFPLESTPPGCSRPKGGAGMNHALSVDALAFLVELLAREKGVELASAYAVTPEGEKIDLTRPPRRRTGFPPSAVRGC